MFNKISNEKKVIYKNKIFNSLIYLFYILTFIVLLFSFVQQTMYFFFIVWCVMLTLLQVLFVYINDYFYTSKKHYVIEYESYLDKGHKEYTFVFLRAKIWANLWCFFFMFDMEYEDEDCYIEKNNYTRRNFATFFCINFWIWFLLTSILPETLIDMFYALNTYV